MPIRKYFLWMGSFLLAALFATDWWLPDPVVHRHSEIPPNERVNLRIRSDQKWPARIVFDTTHRPSLTADAYPEPDIPSSRDLVGSGQRGPLNAFAALELAQAVSVATGDKVSATRAKTRPNELPIKGTN